MAKRNIRISIHDLPKVVNVLGKIKVIGADKLCVTLKTSEKQRKILATCIAWVVE